MHPAFARTDHRPWPLPKRPWVMRQSWCDLLFAHWPIAPQLLRPLVPPELEIECFDGVSWVGVVPFRMEGVSARFLPDLPGLSAFPELNLRLYVTHEGKPGVWFLSLDATSRLAVRGARRFFHLPYFAAEMRCTRRGDDVAYESLRSATEAGARKVAFRASYGPTGSVYRSKAGSLEHFLTERYCLYAQRPDGRLLRAEVHHEPWPLRPAWLVSEKNTIASAQGVAVEGAPPLVHFSERLDVVVWLPELCDASADGRS